MNTEWIRDPRLREIKPAKLSFLHQALFNSMSLSSKQTLPFIMAMAVRAKNENIQFSEAETSLIMKVMKEYASKEDLQQIDQIVQLTKVMRP